MAFLCGSQVRPCGIPMRRGLISAFLGRSDFWRCRPVRWPNSIIVKLFAHLALIMIQIFDMMMLFKWVDYANF